jgi:RNA polymerase sigma-70 factor (ECF subfamily)
MVAQMSIDWQTSKGFEHLFKSMYAALSRYAFTIVTDEMLAEECVQEVFVKVWQQKDNMDKGMNINAYLYRAVHNNAINVLNKNKLTMKYQKHIQDSVSEYEHSPLHNIQAAELQKEIDSAMEKVPEKCRMIFHLSRQEGKTYQEIATLLDLSIKTVENQMSKALRILRLELQDYLPTLVGVLLMLNVMLF